MLTPRPGGGETGPAGLTPSVKHAPYLKKCQQKQRPGQLSGPLTDQGFGRRGRAIRPLRGLLFRRRQALEALQKLFLGHALDRDFGVVGIDAGAGRADQRHGIGLWFVDLDELLERMNQFLAQVFRENRGVGRFPAAETTGFLSLIAINRELRPGRNHTGAMCGQQNQVEPVVDFINAIFHGDARHRLSLR